ncbi:MAG: nucleoside permease [Gammaproteobacteria bacterium]
MTTQTLATEPSPTRRLALMMFLQFFIWGAWVVTLGTYLGSTLQFEGVQIGLVYGTTAIAAIVSPLFVGMIADRFFASQRLFAVLHFVGAALLVVASKMDTFGALYVVMLIYALCYMPTLALANGIAFRHLHEPDREFPLVRVLGTIGWIVAGLLVGFLGIEALNTPLLIAAGASAALGLFALWLPHTPAPSVGQKTSVAQLLGFDAFVVFRERSFLVLFVCSVLISIPLSFYYNFTNLFLNELGMSNAAGKMTLGQGSEVLFMLLMPWLFRRMGIKWMIAAGMFAWVARYAMFAWGDLDPGRVWMLYAGIVLHGICYDFFFVAGQMYADQRSPPALRNSVQSLMTLGTYGLGMFIGSLVSGRVVSLWTSADGVKDWSSIWLMPAAMALFVLLVFLFTFKSPARDEALP